MQGGEPAIEPWITDQGREAVHTLQPVVAKAGGVFR